MKTSPTSTTADRVIPRLFVSAILVAVAACTPPGGGGQSPDAAPETPDAGASDAAPPPPWMPHARFTIAVIPDTQLLFDQDRGNPEVLAASLRWIADHAAERNIVFVAHLGDIVENARPDELAAASQVLRIL